ncbi:hypothetical protein ABIE89_002691 [Bradyrhizobium niftali]
MSEAISGKTVPAYRFAHAGYEATDSQAGPPEEQFEADSPASTTALHG